MIKLIKQFFKFGIVGALAFLIDYGLLFFLTETCGVYYLYSSVISFSVSCIFNYFMSIKWVFNVKKKQTIKDIFLFFLFSTIGLGINQLIMFIFVDLFSIYYMISKLFATAIVLMYNFITRRIILEKDSNKGKKLIERQNIIIGFKILFHTCCILISAIIAGTLLLMLVYTIPTIRMNEHVKWSIDRFQVQGSHYNIFCFPITILDNWTDSWMLGNAIFDNKNYDIIKKSMGVYRYNYVDSSPNDSLVKYYNKTESPSIYSYARYWHGYLVFLKPALLFCKYEEITALNSIIQFFLILYVIFLMKRVGLIRYILPFVISIIMLFPNVISMSMQFSTVFYIMIGSICLILLYDEKLKEKYCYVFLIIGIVTSFLDLLTYPIATLGVPIVFIMLKSEEKLKKQISSIIKYSIFWGIGYIGMWSGKWLVGSVLLQENLFDNAKSAIQIRTSLECAGQKISLFSTVTRNISCYMIRPFLPIYIVVIIYSISRILKNKSWRYISKAGNVLPYIVICLMPIAWYLIASNHSYMHYWFTCRSLVVTIFAGLCILTKLTNNK